MRRLSISLLGLFVASFAGCTQQEATRIKSKESKEAAIKPGEIGSRLPEFALKDLRGHEISSVDLRDKVVLVDFWATWCQPCKKEMPGYQALLNKYAPQGFAVIGFKFDTMMDTEDPLSFVKKLGIRYPLAIASDEIKDKFGGVEGLPTTMLYDRNGILRAKVIGFEYKEKMDSVVKPLL